MIRIKLNTSTIILGSVSLLSLTTNKTLAAEKNQKPNIIFIMSDDHAYQAISAYNDRFAEVAPTPNIDRIAQDGIRFNNCFVTNSISGPSRATILTGKYSHQNGFKDNEGEPFNGAQQTFPKILRKAGYQTAIIGKWHLKSEPTGFDHWEILDDQGEYYNPDFINANGRHTEKGYVTEIITEKSVEWLANNSNSEMPFMLMIHHKAPHREWEPNLKHLESFNGVTFPEPENLFDDYSERGRAAKEQDMTIDKSMRMTADLKMWNSVNDKDYARLRGRLDDEQGAVWDNYYSKIKKDLESKNLTERELVSWKYQRYMNDYLACIKSVDESIGAILDYLNFNGLLENTIVVYTSDQGFYLGEHGWFDKRFMYEESLKTPLFISWHGQTKPNTVNNDFVSNLDFAETFLDAAGVRIPNDMQGISLLPAIKAKKTYKRRDNHYYHYYEYPGAHKVKRHYGIRTADYKLIHFYNDIDEWELYDLKKDPNEMKNVFKEPDYQKTVLKLKRKLKMLQKKYNDNDQLN